MFYLELKYYMRECFNRRCRHGIGLFIVCFLGNKHQIRSESQPKFTDASLKESFLSLLHASAGISSFVVDYLK